MLTLERRQSNSHLSLGFTLSTLTSNYCNSNTTQTISRKLKIKGKVNGALIDYFMQCSDFCHVYKGIVSHRLSVTLNTPWIDGFKSDDRLFSCYGSS